MRIFHFSINLYIVRIYANLLMKKYKNIVKPLVTGRFLFNFLFFFNPISLQYVVKHEEAVAVQEKLMADNSFLLRLLQGEAMVN